MKLIVQVPCYNEAATLPLVINSVPQHIPGIAEIETLIIDDGSSDATVEVARELGVTHIVRHRKNKGLAASFATGLDAALKRKADIIVNIDGDNQHPAEEIPRLIRPILTGTHDVVVADRDVRNIAEFSKLKKFFQLLGSKVVRIASNSKVPDAPCGFRAYSRDAAMATNIVTDFSYTMETIIQAGRKKIAITHVPIRQNPKTRESRLFKGTFQHIRRSGVAIIRSYAMYQPFKIFLLSGTAVVLIGTIPYFRVLLMIVLGSGKVTGHVQSLILGAVFIILGFMFVIIGIVADLIATNRKLLEDALYRLKRIEYGNDDIASQITKCEELEQVPR